MSNKNKLFIVLGVIILILLSFMAGLLIEQKTNSQINKNNNSIPLQIEIQEVIGAKAETEIKKYTLTQEEIYMFFNIINNLTFSNATCDGLASHVISYSSNGKSKLVTYYLETHNLTYHIKSRWCRSNIVK